MSFRNEEEMVRFRFRYARGRCERCGEPVEWEKRGRPYGDEDPEGYWEKHHHPSDSRLEDAFGPSREEFYPDMPINIRIWCWKCHKRPHGRHIPLSPQDPLL